MLNIHSTKRVVTYLILFLTTYLLLRVVPRASLDERDMLITSLILLIVYMVYDMFITNGNFKVENLVSLPQIPPLTLDTIKNDIQKHVETIQSYQSSQAKNVIPPENADIPSVDECSSCKVDVKNNQDVTKTSNDLNMTAYTYKPVYKYEHTGTRAENGVMSNEMSYTDYNTLPIGADVNSKTDDFTYSFLPPDRWYPIPPHPPVCIAEKQCPVCPVLTTGTNVELKEWGDSTRITPGDQINVKYLTEKINSGR